MFNFQDIWFLQLEAATKVSSANRPPQLSLSLSDSSRGLGCNGVGRTQSRSNIGKRKQEARANLQAANFADICLANCINQHR